MKMNSRSLECWQKLLNEYTGNRTTPPAFRIDGTQFSTAKYYGGFTYNGHRYRIEYYADGAMLAIRDDFEKWAKKNGGAK